MNENQRTLGESLKAGLAALAIGTAVALGGCGSHSDKPKAPESVTRKLRVGEYFMEAGDSLRYCGMPNKDTFSLSGVSNYAINYPADTKKIFLINKIYRVVSVDANQITFKALEDKR